MADCEDCPPVGYPTDKTRCAPCPRRTTASTPAEKEVGEAQCFDCARPYGTQHGFPDLIIPFADWCQISPTGDDGGLLCPSCICKRLDERGLTCDGAFMSGPIMPVSRATMSALRRVENIELAITGRDNVWSSVRDLRLARAARAEMEKA